MYISLRTKTLPLGKVFKQKHDLCGVPPLWLGQNSSLPYLQKFLISTHLSASQQLHSSGLHRVYPAHVQCDPQPRIGREPACWCPGTLCMFLFFFLNTLTHIFHTYYDPQTHFCLLNKIFNFVELHLYPFQPYMYSQVKRKSRPTAHFICFSSHTAPRPCCQLHSVKMTVWIFCLVLWLSSVQSSQSVMPFSLQPHGL